MAGRSKVCERRAGAVVVTQCSAFFCCRNLGEEVNHVVRLDLTLLLVKEAVDLAARCGIQESGEKDKDPRPPIHHSCSDTLLLLSAFCQLAGLM